MIEVKNVLKDYPVSLSVCPFDFPVFKKLLKVKSLLDQIVRMCEKGRKRERKSVKREKENI